ncbi:MAG: arginine--tRNA ligase [Thermoplasmata archaeon]|nr:MAG: arginine--tRNA ligase [Thermoplasmata archaeon]
MEYPYFKAISHVETKIKFALQKLSLPNEVKLEIPPQNLSDFAFPCFSLCKISKCSPKETAEKIASEINEDKIIDSISSDNGYINITLNSLNLINETLSLIHTKKDKYGFLPKKNQQIIIEHTSANPNGPLHVGRARNPIIGDTLTRIYKASGYECTSQFYLDDLGKQVAILTWGLNNISKEDINKEKNIKPDHQAVTYYQKANELMNKDKQIQKDIGQLVKQSEHGNNEIIEKIKQAYNPVLEGINESLSTININIDSYIPESTFVKDKSVEMVISKLKKSEFCFEENGAFYLDLESFGIKGRNTKFFITRGDGTSLYATRDIAYHVWKSNQADQLINVLGEDHKLEAKQVEICLKLLGHDHIPHPVFYAFVSLPGGKMSTRNARLVYLDEIIDDSIKRAYDEVKKRRKDELTEKQMQHISKIIGIGAIRYNIIKVQPEKDIVFKWEEALNFEGNAAPFIQYSHARAAGILTKNLKQNILENINQISKLTHNSEINLCKKLSMFPKIIQDAAEGFKPHLIASYLFETASLFNQFYRDCPVLSEKDKKTQNERLILVSAFKIVIHNGLELLGIDAPDEM